MERIARREEKYYNTHDDETMDEARWAMAVHRAQNGVREEAAERERAMHVHQ